MSNVIKFPARTKVYSLSFKITEVFHMTKNDTNSDIGLEIQNGIGTAYVPATTKDEARRRLHTLLPVIEWIEDNEI